MFTRIGKRMRIRAALAVVFFYSFCAVAPSTAMAFSPRAAHCLTDAQGMASHVHRDAKASTVHQHADGSTHSHRGDEHAMPQNAGTQGDAGHSGNDSGTCCGLFCLTILAHDPAALVPVPPDADAAVPGLQSRLDGRAPGRINRPPIG
jgi:hypothetical protein